MSSVGSGSPELPSTPGSSSYSPSSPDTFNHLVTPTLDVPLQGGDIEDDLEWEDVLIEVQGDRYKANSAKLKIVSVFFQGRLTTFAPEEENRDGQHKVCLSSDSILTSKGIKAVLGFVEALFRGDYHRRKVYDADLVLASLRTNSLLTASNAGDVLKAAEFLQVRDLVPVCLKFIREEVINRSNFISFVSRDEQVTPMDYIRRYVEQRYLVGAAEKRRRKYGEFDLVLNFYGIFSIECHATVVSRASTVLKGALQGKNVKALDMKQFLKNEEGLAEGLFNVVDWMYFRGMQGMQECTESMLKVATCLNVVDLVEDLCKELSPKTSKEWLAIYRASKLANKTVRRRALLHLIRSLEPFSAAVPHVDFEDLLLVVKSDLGLASEKILFDSINAWYFERRDTCDGKSSKHHKRLLEYIQKGAMNAKEGDTEVQRRAWPSHVFLSGLTGCKRKHLLYKIGLEELLTSDSPKRNPWKYVTQYNEPGDPLSSSSGIALNAAKDSFYYLSKNAYDDGQSFAYHTFDLLCNAMTRGPNIDGLAFNRPIAGYYGENEEAIVVESQPRRLDPTQCYVYGVVKGCPPRRMVEKHGYAIPPIAGDSPASERDGLVETQIVHHSLSGTTYVFGVDLRLSDDEDLKVLNGKTGVIKQCASQIYCESAFVEYGEGVACIGGWRTGAQDDRAWNPTRSRQSLASVRLLDLDTLDISRELPSLRSARYGCSALNLGADRILVAGGVCEHRSSYETYDPVTETWTVGDLPSCMGTGRLKLFLVPDPVTEDTVLKVWNKAAK